MLFLLHDANCEDSVLFSEDEGTQISGRRERFRMSHRLKEHTPWCGPCSFLSDGGTTVHGA